MSGPGAAEFNDIPSASVAAADAAPVAPSSSAQPPQSEELASVVEGLLGAVCLFQAQRENDGRWLDLAETHAARIAAPTAQFLVLMWPDLQMSPEMRAALNAFGAIGVAAVDFGSKPPRPLVPPSPSTSQAEQADGGA